ncbi:MAG: hypothetical protein JSR77_17380 [Planctomycetes bacterium]|nr:hypothetical protein [Planctomycetota bacterium]
MRLPASKVYRAFPELDRFSDEQCEGFVALIRRKRSGSFNSVMLLGTLAGLLVLGPVIEFQKFMTERIEVYVPALPDSWLWAIAKFLLFVIVTSIIVAAATYIPRDVWMRAVISRVIRRARCLGCGYTLLGLDVQGDLVTCPECGEKSSLSQRGLSEGDIIAKAAAS